MERVSKMPNVLQDLTARGLIAQCTDQEALAVDLAKGPITYYCGFDPTAPSLHIGNLVQILALRRLQLAGHCPLGLVGGATGLVGDPKLTGERVLNDPEIVAGWVERIRQQIEPLLDFEGPYAARMVNNLDWTAPMGAIELLRDIGKHFRMSTMLAKETVAARLRSDQGLSFTEFAYQVMQGLDFRELYRRYGCILQTGGNDQWGNLLAGVELVHKSDQATVHAFTTPLVAKADGTKFGKTEAGTVWLDPAMTTPYAFHQFWLNQDDRDVASYLKVFSFRELPELAELATVTAQRPHERAAQKALADDVTTLVHGAAATAQVKAAAAALFGGGDLRALAPDTLEAAVAGLPSTEVTDQAALVVELLALSGLEASKGAARRTLASGGVYLNNVKVEQADQRLSGADWLHGRWALLRRGRKTLGVARLVN